MAIRGRKSEPVDRSFCLVWSCSRSVPPSPQKKEAYINNKLLAY